MNYGSTHDIIKRRHIKLLKNVVDNVQLHQFLKYSSVSCVLIATITVTSIGVDVCVGVWVVIHVAQLLIIIWNFTEATYSLCKWTIIIRTFIQDRKHIFDKITIEPHFTSTYSMS